MVNISDVYMHAGVDEYIIVRFNQTMTEMLDIIDLKIYKPYGQVNSAGKKVLYAKLKKALYGCLKSGLLFWRNLANHLQSYGFILNPYNSCVANKIINQQDNSIIGKLIG